MGLLHARHGMSLPKGSTLREHHRSRINYIGFGGDGLFAFRAGPAENTQLDILVQIKMLDFLFYNPVRHRIDVKSNDVTSKSVGLKQGGSSPHEGVGDPDSVKPIGLIEGFRKWFSRNSDSSKPRKSVPGLLANHLCTAIIGLIFCCICFSRRARLAINETSKFFSIMVFHFQALT